MLVAIAHCQKENAQAKQLATWVAELGPYPNHRLLVGRDEHAEPNLFANSGFSKVEEITIVGDAWNKWPESCNNAFRQIAKYIEYGTKEPWLWCEVDCVPLKSDWLDKIEAEYKASGKPFLGDFVHLNEPGFLDHCSGVAVYPGRMSHHAGDALFAHEFAWDVAASSQILPQMHKSKLILHRWKYPAFDSWEQVEQRIFAVKPDCVLFHSDKRGSLIPLLREKLSGGESIAGKRDALLRDLITPKQGAMSEVGSGTDSPTRNDEQTSLKSHESGHNVTGLAAQPFSCDIFIKSFPGDFEWLRYCLRSVSKFASGFRQVIVVIPNGTRDELTSHIVGTREPLLATTTIIEVEESANGYLGQQVQKLNADKYTDATHVLFLDSDCIFTRPVTPETFMRDGRIMWLMTPMDKTREDQRAAWMPVMTKWMNKVPEYEFMHRHPFMFPRWFFEKIRGFCANQHGVTLDDYIMSQPGRSFSEFNNAGFLAYEHFHDRFEWINTETDQLPPATVLQHWSPGGLTEEIKAKLETILCAPADNWQEGALDLTGDETAKSCTTTNSSLIASITGTHADNSREALIRDAVGVLKQLCTAPRYISQVRKELKAQGVIRR